MNKVHPPPMHMRIRVYERANRPAHNNGASRTKQVRDEKTVWKQRYFGHNADYFRVVAFRPVIAASLHALRRRLR
jgi:hypothetical protein